MKPGTRWTYSEQAIFSRMWREDVPIKAICAELGRTKGAIQEQRERMGLPTRRCARVYHFTVHLTAEETRVLRSGAGRNRTSMASYLRSLLRRDAGVCGGSVVVHHDRGERTVIMGAGN